MAKSRPGLSLSLGSERAAGVGEPEPSVVAERQVVGTVERQAGDLGGDHRDRHRRASPAGCPPSSVASRVIPPFWVTYSAPSAPSVAPFGPPPVSAMRIDAAVRRPTGDRAPDDLGEVERSVDPDRALRELEVAGDDLPVHRRHATDRRPLVESRAPVRRSRTRRTRRRPRRPAPRTDPRRRSGRSRGRTPPSSTAPASGPPGGTMALSWAPDSANTSRPIPAQKWAPAHIAQCSQLVYIVAPPALVGRQVDRRPAGQRQLGVPGHVAGPDRVLQLGQHRARRRRRAPSRTARCRRRGRTPPAPGTGAGGRCRRRSRARRYAPRPSGRGASQTTVWARSVSISRPSAPENLNPPGGRAGSRRRTP